MSYLMALSSLMNPNMAAGAVPGAFPGPVTALQSQPPSVGGQVQEHPTANQADNRAKGTQRRAPGEGSLRQCQVKGCTKQPKFGVDPGKARWCKVHAPINAKDVIHKQCEHEGCLKRPNYGLQAKRPRWCITHAPPEARDVVNKQCIFPMCRKQPYYGLERRKPVWCKAHAPSGASDVVHKLCEVKGCIRRPSYGLEPKIARWCKECAPAGIGDVISSDRNRPAVFGWKGSREDWHALSRTEQDKHWEDFQKLPELHRFELRRATLNARGIKDEPHVRHEMQVVTSDNLVPSYKEARHAAAMAGKARESVPGGSPAVVAGNSDVPGPSNLGAVPFELAGSGDEVQRHPRSQRVKKTSQFRGVSWSKPKHRWQACIRVARRQFFLGRYQDEREAAQAYDRAALRHYPADAVRTNFPVEVYLSELEAIREGKPPTQANPRRQAIL